MPLFGVLQVRVGGRFFLFSLRAAGVGLDRSSISSNVERTIHHHSAAPGAYNAVLGARIKLAFWSQLCVCCREMPRDWVGFLFSGFGPLMSLSLIAADKCGMFEHKSIIVVLIVIPWYN
ncbi:hypothetical protein CRENBAI_012121 [Crenichthys baileyi]|uniref:Uncharacterized protein n=1 Tax=Crenichthys baileyi TaxID=28760 RepID=A0AAV9SIJ9_9TELE